MTERKNPNVRLVFEKKYPYYEVKQKSTLDAGLSMLALKIDDWVDYYNFEAIKLPTEIATENCTFLDKLNEAHPFHCGIIKMKPNTFYDWHVDTNRGVSINMQLGVANSFCVFEDGERLNEMVGRFTSLEYHINTYFVFNNQVPHTVYNFDRIRYLFSLEFEEDKTKLTFDQLVEEIKSW